MPATKKSAKKAATAKPAKKSVAPKAAKTASKKDSKKDKPDLAVVFAALRKLLGSFKGEISTENQHAPASFDKSCGMIFSVRFALQGDDWSSDSYKVTDCSQERVWTPKDP